MNTILGLINHYSITMTCEWAESNPQMINTEWAKGAQHYKIKLMRKDGNKKRKLTLYYSMGKALCREPTVEEVINCLNQDYLSIQNEPSFEIFAENHGINVDSRKAFENWKISIKLNKKYTKFMGEKLLKEFSECEPL